MRGLGRRPHSSRGHSGKGKAGSLVHLSILGSALPACLHTMRPKLCRHPSPSAFPLLLVWGVGAGERGFCETKGFQSQEGSPNQTTWREVGEVDGKAREESGGLGRAGGGQGSRGGLQEEGGVRWGGLQEAPWGSSTTCELSSSGGLPAEAMGM